MTTFVSLFRGINVGGNRVVPMDQLKDLYLSAGFRDVVTYIQSGNVVCTGDDADPAHIAKRIEDGFTQKFGFHAQVIVRTATEVQQLIANNPFQNQPEKEAKWIVVVFLAAHPASTALDNLHKAYVGPEEFYLTGQELYVYYPDGIGRSKLTLTLMEKHLKTAGTARNWNTVLQLQAIVVREGRVGRRL